ncbi:histidine kinase [Arsenicibacter rosenii]|uniref:Histidine kinase n=2 Tax=Arsenicibacter rosenii TaxID=1750698 RepID=A0A1S2VQA8_9BACT|nr:histidine kinase [Arsenicibacter rosenii]
MNLAFPRLSANFIRNSLYLLAFFVQLFTIASSPGRLSYFTITFTLARWISVYIYHVWVLNRFLPTRKYVAILAGTLLAGLSFIAVRYSLEEIISPLLFNARNYADGTTLAYYIQDNLYFALPTIGLGWLVKLVEDWFTYQIERSSLVSERNTAELAFLKSQVNPHFLFNTLNNIYALAYTKSPEAPEAILKLSGLMRYMLYESSSPDGQSQKVALSKEVKYLTNLIDLEKIRVANAQVHVQTEGNLDLYRIEPLLLITFVENAFKHGDLTNASQPLTILLSVKQGQLTFITKNKKSQRQKDAVGGIGLQNVQRRLALLYPNRHTLQINDENGSYVCHLTIQL